RQQGACLIHHGRVIAGALGQGRNRSQVSARDALADAFIGERDKSFTDMRQFRDYQRSSDVESELVPAQNGFVAAPLPDLVRHSIQRVIAEILEDSAVPLRSERRSTGLRAVSARA